MAKGFILGFIAAIVAVAAGGYSSRRPSLPAGQAAKPSQLEEWAAEASLRDDSPRGSGAKVSYPTD